MNTHKNDCGSGTEAAARMLTFIPASAQRLLLCDCGDGALGALLRQRGAAEVYGVALCTQNATLARQHLDHVQEVERPAEGPGRLPRQHFDAVVIENCLEMQRDPGRFLKAVRDSVLEDAFMAVVVPNVQYFQTTLMLAEGRWHPGQEQASSSVQLRFFTAYEISRLLNQHGFDVKACAIYERDPDEAFPLDEDRIARVGRVHIGPLDNNAYLAYLTRRFIVLAQKI